jgi:glycosyltransferase involved in cell wall biosynthesis
MLHLLKESVIGKNELNSMHIGIAGPIHLPSLNIKYRGDRGAWPIGMGGVPVNHLINGLLELGYKISVFSSSPEIKVGSSFEWHEENLSIYIGPHRVRAKYVCIDFFALESNYIKKAIIKAKPDFVHAHWQYEWALGALKSKVKTLITCHDSPFHVLKAQPDLYRLYRLIMAIVVINRAKYLTAVSDYCKTGLVNLTFKRITVIPNFEPDYIFSLHKDRTLSTDQISIAMVNNGFTKLKNVTTGILAFNQFRLEYPNSKLHLYGSGFGKSEDAYKWCISSNIPTTNVYFKGECQFRNLMEKLSEADIFLHTSLEESFGMALVEAMAMGIPVIAGINSGGPGYILKDGGGLLVNINSVKDIKVALDKLIIPSNYIKQSKLAREVALKRFSKNKVVNQYLEFYQKVI